MRLDTSDNIVTLASNLGVPPGSVLVRGSSNDGMCCQAKRLQTPRGRHHIGSGFCLGGASRAWSQMLILCSMV